MMSNDEITKIKMAVRALVQSKEFFNAYKTIIDKGLIFKGKLDSFNYH